MILDPTREGYAPQDLLWKHLNPEHVKALIGWWGRGSDLSPGEWFVEAAERQAARQAVSGGGESQATEVGHRLAFPNVHRSQSRAQVA